MRKFKVLMALGLVWHVVQTPESSETSAYIKVNKKIILQVDPSGFNTDLRSLQSVLEGAVAEVWQYCPDQSLASINVKHNDKFGPMVLYKRANNGGHTVLLASNKTYWCQFVYQFSHEFCHILCGYRPEKNPNKWFEESLCEMASIFTLRRMAEKWKVDPPYRNWKGYNMAFKEYSDKLVKRATLKSKRANFTAWFERHYLQLRRLSHSRYLNSVIAVNILLPHFEKNPGAFNVLPHLNKEKDGCVDCSFTEYLQIWKDHSPRRYHKFIDTIAEEFGVVLTDTEY